MLAPWCSPWLNVVHLCCEMTASCWEAVLAARPASPLGAPDGRHAQPPARRFAAHATPAETAPAALNGLRVGDRRVLAHTVAEEDLAAFAAATGDCNPLHIDEAYAARTRFGRRIAHGMLSAAFFSAALATLGGRRATTVYLSQSLSFLRPVVVGDRITIELEILDVDAPKRRLTVKTHGHNQRGEKVVSGQALVLLDPYPYVA